ncbi:hypothetical protein [Ileibacterium valens]|uniref:hypothetical protein n=1 Tax=Ileibacterium valens TaxID=1862668 RepID=UPI0027295950|nr:hypothetical protein [Ileibacterium valens]
MKNKSKGIRLNNVIFPLYMIMLLSPYMWLIMLAGNFLIDSLVLIVSGRLRKIRNMHEIWKKSILKVFLFGFLSDLIGCLINSILFILLSITLPDLLSGINFYFWPGCAIEAIPTVLIAGWLIYLFNKKWSFSKTDLDTGTKKKLALGLAVFTAPYIMFAPMDFLDGLLTAIGRLFGS